MATEKRTFTISVLRENEVIYYGECNALTVPSMKDSITILPYHTPIIMKMGEGNVIMHTGRKKETLCSVKRGLLYVGDNEVTVLADL